MKPWVALGVLTPKLGEIPRPMAYFSKQLGFIASGWSSCLQVVAAIALLVEEAIKLTLEQPLEVLIPHQVQGVLEIKGEQRVDRKTLN